MQLSLFGIESSVIYREGDHYPTYVHGLQNDIIPLSRVSTGDLGDPSSITAWRDSQNEAFDRVEWAVDYYVRCFDRDSAHVGAIEPRGGEWARHYVYGIDIDWYGDNVRPGFGRGERWVVSCTTPPDAAIARIAVGTVSELTGPVRDSLPTTVTADSSDETICGFLDAGPQDEAQRFLQSACTALEEREDIAGAISNFNSALDTARIADAEAGIGSCTDILESLVSLNKSLVAQDADIGTCEVTSENREDQVIYDIASILNGFIPVVGTLVEWYNAYEAVDVWNGDQLSGWDRVLAVIPFGRKLRDLSQLGVEKISEVSQGIRRRIAELWRDESGTVRLGRGGWTNQAARQRAWELGFRQVSTPKIIEQNVRGETVFEGRLPITNERVYISPDRGGHGQQLNPEKVWKVFRRSSGARMGTYSNNLERFIRD